MSLGLVFLGLVFLGLVYAIQVEADNNGNPVGSPTGLHSNSLIAWSTGDHNHNPLIKEMYLGMVWKNKSMQLKNGADFL